MLDVNSVRYKGRQAGHHVELGRKDEPGQSDSLPWNLNWEMLRTSEDARQKAREVTARPSGEKAGAGYEQKPPAKVVSEGVMMEQRLEITQLQ